MRLISRTLVAAAALAVAALAPVAQAAPKAGKSGPPTTCTVQSYSYDSGGAAGAGSPNDPLYARQWGLDRINAPEAWARSARGQGVTVAVLDTGVDLQHPDLQSQLVQGVDLQAGKRDCPPGPQDENGHGTHVSGIVAAVANNGIGVAGTAPDATIMPIRVLDAEGSGDLDGLVKGIRYAADHGAKVLNMSLGFAPLTGNLFSGEIQSAVDYAWSKGAVVVAAAGNESFPLCDHPAAANHVVCVGATDRRGLPSYYSNFPNNQEGYVGVRAPGGAGMPRCEDDEDIWSTIWPGSDLDCQGSATLTGRSFTNGYDTLAGTSMASPHVAGVAALLLSKGLTNEQAVEKLRTTSSNQGAYDPVYGYGIVDADAATR